MIGSSRPWRSTHTSVRCGRLPQAHPSVHTPVRPHSTSRSGRRERVLAAATSSTSGTGPPLTASVLTSNAHAEQVLPSAYTRWPVGTYRASVPPPDDVARAGVERLDDDLGRIPVHSAGQREQNGAPTGQQLRTVGDLTGLDLHEFSGFPPSPDTRQIPSRALPVENRVVGRPTRAQWVCAAHSTTGAPPVIETFLSCPSCQKPIHWPSGEKNGFRPAVSGQCLRCRGWVWPRAGPSHACRVVVRGVHDDGCRLARAPPHEHRYWKTVTHRQRDR